MSKREEEKLSRMYREAALKAHEQGVRADNEDALLAWIRENVRYRTDTEFFLFLGIGSALADIEAQKEGYANQAERAYDIARKKLGM